MFVFLCALTLKLSSPCHTVEPDLMATETRFLQNHQEIKMIATMIANDGIHINEKTTPIYVLMGIISIADSNDSHHFSLVFSQPLDGLHQIRFHSTKSILLTK